MHSLVILRDGSVWGWGEAKLGQIGVGKQREVRLPHQIIFPNNQGNFVQCAAGDGDLYSWGFNVYGQLGLGDKKTRWTPELVSYSN